MVKAEEAVIDKMRYTEQLEQQVAYLKEQLKWQNEDIDERDEYISILEERLSK